MTTDNLESANSQWKCPGIGCNYLGSGPVDLAKHVNLEHPGGYNDDDWPDLS